MSKRFGINKASCGRLLCAAAAVLLATNSSRADKIFNVNVDTTGLVGSSSAPFTIDFQLNDGLQPSNNTATLNHFTFGGGPFTGSSTLSGGGSGNLSSGIVIHDSSFANSVDQGFTSGSNLNFDVDLTTAVDSGGVPDQFSFAILDKNMSELGTTDSSGANTIITVNLDSADPTIQQYASSPDSFGKVTVTVPEPAFLGWVVLGALSLLAHRKARPSATLLS